MWYEIQLDLHPRRIALPLIRLSGGGGRTVCCLIVGLSQIADRFVNPGLQRTKHVGDVLGFAPLPCRCGRCWRAPCRNSRRAMRALSNYASAIVTAAVLTSASVAYAQDNVPVLAVRFPRKALAPA